MAQAKKKPAPGVTGTQLVIKMAEANDLDPQAFTSTVIKSCFDPKNDTTPEQLMAFLLIAKEHNLNPLTREIFAFAKAGKVTPIVSIDGWLKIINQHPQFGGIRFTDNLDDENNLISITCYIFRKDREIPIEVTEYLDECQMPTEPWKKWPARMLRHKATIQCARYAFGFAGIYDPDEGARIQAGEDITGTATVVPEDLPEKPAARIVHQIKTKRGEADSQPPEATQEPVDDTPVDLDDIPGLQKGSDIKGDDAPKGETMPDGEEISPENKEWIEDYESEDPATLNDQDQ